MRPRAGLACMAIMSIAVALPSEADSGTGPETNRGRAALHIGEIFERFFFASWLGEPLSLGRSGACPEAQVVAAIGQKQRFPDTFLRRGPQIPAKYCGAVATERAGAENWTFVLRVPKVKTCDDYAERWRAFISPSATAEAIESYVILNETYDKYGIEEQSRAIYLHPLRVMPRHAPDRKPLYLVQSHLKSIRRFHLVAQREINSVCYFDFSHEGKPNRPKT